MTGYWGRLALRVTYLLTTAVVLAIVG